jgi:hypothetical protein
MVPPTADLRVMPDLATPGERVIRRLPALRIEASHPFHAQREGVEIGFRTPVIYAAPLSHHTRLR